MPKTPAKKTPAKKAAAPVETPVASQGWRITWGGRSWTENDLTGAHAALVVMLSGADSFDQLDPFRGPMALMQLIAAFVSIADERDALDVISELGRTPLAQLLAAVTVD